MSSVKSHKRYDHVCEMLGHVLILSEDARAWCGLSTVLQVRLSPMERSLLLAAVLNALDLDDALFVLERTLRSRLAGAPAPGLGTITDEARWWAELASQEELRTWLVECFVRLPAREQVAFLREASARCAA